MNNRWKAYACGSPSNFSISPACQRRIQTFSIGRTAQSSKPSKYSFFGQCQHAAALRRRTPWGIPLSNVSCGRAKGRQRRSISAFLWGPGDKDKRPMSKNALDTTMAWGDILTLLATELASERIPLSVCGLHCSVTMLAWVGVAFAKGDYRLRAPSFLFGAHRKAMLLASISGAATWALFVPTVLAGYASLVTHQMLDPAVLVSHSSDAQLPAQLEVIFASLWSLVCWRGIYAALRPYI